MIFLAITGALSGFIDYFRLFGPGHSISGAIPTQWSLLHNPAVTAEFFLPVVLVVMTIWRVVAKLRGRRSWSTRDWTMIAAASWVLLYYGKGLGRADAGHVGETFTVTIPLLLLWVIELLAICDPFVRRVLATRRARGWVPRHLVTVLAIVAVVACAPQWIVTLDKTAVQVRSVVPTEPTVPRLGYALPKAINTTMLTDLKVVLDRYAGTRGPVFDFSNDPGVLYYLLGRTPGTRYFTVSMAIPYFAQQMLVSELEKSRPKVVVFNDVTNGLPQWDGIVNMVRHYFVSQYILDHYTPFVDVDGQLIMLRSDLVSSAAALPHVSGTLLTSDLYFDAPTCDWGDAPNFLRIPGEPVSGSAVAVPTHVVADGFGLVSGWAIDHAADVPAREVMAISDGRVVATTHPDIARADVARALKSSGVLRSGFSLVLSRGQGPVQLYALNRDNTVTPLQLSTAVDRKVITPGKATSLRTDDGVVHRVTALERERQCREWLPEQRPGPQGGATGGDQPHILPVDRVVLGRAPVVGQGRPHRRGGGRGARDLVQRVAVGGVRRCGPGRQLPAMARIHRRGPYARHRSARSHTDAVAGAIAPAPAGEGAGQRSPWSCSTPDEVVGHRCPARHEPQAQDRSSMAPSSNRLRRPDTPRWYPASVLKCRAG